MTTASHAGIMERFVQSFQSHSSPIDWCEPNYVVSARVAEFFNTVSNAPFLLVPPLSMWLFRAYGHSVSRHVHIIWALLVCVGVASAYFHATLSLAGQLLDEFGILWVVTAAVAFWLPERLLPTSLARSNNRFPALMLVFSVTMTFLACLWPAVNAVVLLCCGLPASVLIWQEIKMCTDERACSLATRSMIVFVLAVVVWISDRVSCPLWTGAGLPYGHSIWHVLVFISAHQVIVFMAYRDALAIRPQTRPMVAYWPVDSWQHFGVPYVKLLSPLPLVVGRVSTAEGAMLSIAKHTCCNTS